MPSFDTLTYARKLQEAGFTPQQAEAQAAALRAVVEENLASKRDIEELRRDGKEIENRLLATIETLRGDVKRDTKEIETRLLHEIVLVRRDVETMRRDIIIWLGGMIVAATSVLGMLIKVL